MNLRTAILIFVLTMTFGCVGLRVERFRESPADWITEGGSQSRTNSTSAQIRLPLEEVWQYNAQAGVRAVPLVRDSVVVVATLNGEIQAVNLSDGKRIGYKTFESAIVGTPVLRGSSVIFTMAGKSETVISFDLSSGKKNWGFEAGPVESSPLLSGDHLYVTTVRGDVYCLLASTGNEVWKFEGGGKERLRGFRSSPSTDGTLVVFGSDDGVLYALDGASGEEVWTRQTGGSIFAAPVLLSNMAVVGNLKGSVVAVDMTNGEVRWTYDVGSPVYAAAASDGRSLFCSAANGTVYALDQKGRLNWKFSTKAILNAAPLVTDGVLFAGSMDRVLYALDVLTGKELWRYTAEGRIRVSPVLWGNVLLVTSEDKYITMLRPL